MIKYEISLQRSKDHASVQIILDAGCRNAARIHPENTFHFAGFAHGYGNL